MWILAEDVTNIMHIFYFPSQNPLVRSFFLTNLTLTDSGYQWRIDLDAIKDNLPAIMGFPSEFPTNQYNGETLFIGGGRSDYIQ